MQMMSFQKNLKPKKKRTFSMRKKADNNLMRSRKERIEKDNSMKRK